MSEGTSRSRGHWVGVGAILVIAWLFVVIGVIGIYMHRSLYNEQAFSKRVTAVLAEPGVQAAVATELTNEIVKAVPKAIIARPIIQSAAETVVAEPAFTEIVSAALVKFHAILLDPETASIVFRIEGAPQLLQERIAPFDEQLAVAVGSAASAQLAKLPNPGPAFRAIQLGADLGPVAWIVAFLGLGLMALAAVIAPRRRSGAISALVTLALAGLGVVLILGFVRIGLNAATADNQVMNEAAAGIFAGLFGTLRTIGWVIAAIGVIGAVVVWSLRWTMPVAAGAAGQVGGAAAGAAGQLGSAAGDAAGALTAGAGSAVATMGERKVAADDLMIAARNGVRRLFVPAASTQGKLLQGLVALVIAVLVLFAWSVVVDVLIIAIALGLFALALNRVLLVVFEHRQSRAVAAAEQPAVGAGTPDA